MSLTPDHQFQSIFRRDPAARVLTIAAASTRARWLGSTSNALNLDVQRDAFGIRYRACARGCATAAMAINKGGNHVGPKLDRGGCRCIGPYADQSAVRRRPMTRSTRTGGAVVALCRLRTARPAFARPDQAVGTRTTGAADARVSGDPGGEHRGSGAGRTGQFPHHHRPAPPACHT